MTTSLLDWARAFAFTQIVEAPIYRHYLGVSWPRALLASTVTHPVVWFFFPWFARQFEVGYVPMVCAAELFAWLAEAAFFTKTKPTVAFRRSLLLSFVANASSVALGLASRWLFGAP